MVAMSLHVLRPITIFITCWFFVFGVDAQEELTSSGAANSPWKTPSEQADMAVADWASQTLKSTNSADSAIINESTPQKLSPSAPAEKTEEPVVNTAGNAQPFAIETVTNNPNDPALRYPERSTRDSFVPQQEPAIRYEPNDQPTSVNPLRSGAVQNPSFARQPAPMSAAERAFAAPQPGQQSVVPSSPPNYSGNLAAQTAFSEPVQNEATKEPSSEPSAFNQTIESNARPITPILSSPNEMQASMPQAERSVLASRQSLTPQTISVQPTTTQSTTEPNWKDTDSQSYSMNSADFGTDRLGTGQPGDERLEGPQSPALKIEKRGPPEARVGQPCRFVVTVRNTGNQTAENVMLRDEVPAGARLIETVPTASQEAGQIVWQLGTLAPGEQRSVELRVSPERQGPLGSVATVSFDASASAKTICTKPELAIRLSAPAKVLVGNQQPLKVEVHNPGTGMATNFVLVEEVPQNMRHEAGPSLEFEVGSLAPGETRQLDLLLTAEQAGEVLNRLTASADGNLRVEQTVAFEVVAPSLALAVEGPKRRYLESPASYTVNIDNPGSAPAKDVRIVTQLPSGMKFVSANNLGEYDAETHSVYWSLAELPEGERGAVKLTALPVTAGEHTLRVNGEANNGLKTSESQNIVVEGVVSLAFDVRDRQDPIEIGSDAVYDVVVTNEGTKPATAVRVTVDSPAGMQVVDAQGKVEHRVAEGRVEFAPIPTLRPGEKFPYRIRLRGTQAGDQRISVAVESEDLQQPIRREESTRVFGDE